jgi:nucleotide-binding universal stress UspA family protein
MNPIVLATDGSPSARRATQAAIALAQTTGWPLRIVAAWTLPTGMLAFGPPLGLPELEERERERAESAVREAAEAAAAAGVNATRSVHNGDAAETIFREATDLRAALIVMGAHGWSPPQKTALGTVSAAIVQKTPCPVLLVRSDTSALEAGLHHVDHAA